MTREEQAKLNEHLLEAATSGNNAEVGRLLNSGANVNAVDTFGNTPLHRAARFGHTEVVQELLAAKTDVNAVNTNKYTPLHIAALCGHLTIAKALIEAKTDVNAVNTNKYTPLHWAAVEGHTNIVKELIVAGTNVNAVNTFGYTPLDMAAAEGKTDTVKALIVAGADVNRFLDNALEKDTEVYNNVISAVAEVIIDTYVPQKLNKETDNKSENMSTPLLQDHGKKSGIKLENIEEKHRGAVKKRLIELQGEHVGSYTAQVAARAAGKSQKAGCAIS